MAIPRYLEFAQRYPVTTAALGTGIASGVEMGRGALQSMTQVQQMRQRGALAPYQRQLMAAQVQQMPYKTQLLQAQTDALVAKAQEGAAALSPMGKLVSDYNKAVKDGDTEGAKDIETSIEGTFAKQRQQLLTPGEKAFETQTSKDFVAASVKVSQDADLGSQIIDQTRTFQKAYNDIPTIAKGFAYNKFTSPKIAFFSGKLGS